MRPALTADRVRDALALAAAALLCLASFTYSLAIDRQGLDVPLHYSGDSLQYGYLIQHFSALGGVGRIDSAGAPFGTQHYDFPNADYANLALASAFSIGGSFGLGFNLFYLFGVLATCLSGYALARRIGLNPAWALVAAVAFTLLPFHFLRQHHLFYTNYSSLAVGLWLALDASGSGDVPMRMARPRVRLGLLALGAIWCASTGVYYAFFSCLIIGFAGLCATLEYRRAAPLLRSLTLCTLIAGGVLVQLVPALLFKGEAGPNTSVAQRHFAESEIYSTRLAQLLMPNANHPIEPLGRLRRAYDAGAPNVNENATSSVGLLAAVGLALAALLLAVPRMATVLSPLAHPLARLTAFVFLFATTGGLASLFAIAVTPQIRAVNRISPLLALLAILLACLAMQYLLRRHRLRIHALLTAPLIGLIMLDQVPTTRASSITERSVVAAHYRADVDFAKSLVQGLPAGARVFQLPHIAYPEAGSALGDYRQFRNHLHAPSLRFTHGAMRGRPEAEWLQLTAARPPVEFADSLTRFGFAAVVVDSAEQHPTVRAQAAALAQRGWTRLDANDGSQFALIAPLAAAPSARAVAAERGWYPLERGGDGHQWRWSMGTASLKISAGDGDRDCETRLRLSARKTGEVSVRVDGSAHNQHIMLWADRASDIVLQVPAGARRIELQPDAPASAPSTSDPRPLAIMLHLTRPLECSTTGPAASRR